MRHLVAIRLVINAREDTDVDCMLVKGKVKLKRARLLSMPRAC